MSEYDLHTKLSPYIGRIDPIRSHVSLFIDQNQSPLQFICLCTLGNLWCSSNKATRSLNA